MSQFVILKLLVDALLVAALFYFAMRSIRNGSNAGMSSSLASGAAARELRDLEISLKTLLRDADVSSQGLNSSLARQQRNLQQLLNDISETEARVQQALDSGARASRTKLNHSESNLKRALISEESEQEYFAPTPVQVPMRPAPSTTVSAQKLNVFGEPIGAASDFATDQSSQTMAYRAHETKAAAAPSAIIQGTPESREKTKAPIYRQQRLAQQIEVERAVASLDAAQKSVASLTAQENSQEQSRVQSSKQTQRSHNLEVSQEFITDELPVLSNSRPEQEYSQQQSADNSEAADQTEIEPRIIQKDARLGVLGSVRRHTQVL